MVCDLAENNWYYISSEPEGVFFFPSPVESHPLPVNKLSLAPLDLCYCNKS